MARKKSLTPNETVPLMLRLPPEVHAAIKEMAEKERRSLNSTVVVLLDAQLACKHRQPSASAN
jgi:hypothetical protein